MHGQVAQLVEHGPEKAGVGGSRPPLSTRSKPLWQLMRQEASLAWETGGPSARVAGMAFLAVLAGHVVIDGLVALVPASLGLLEVRVGMTAQQSAWLLGLGPLCSGLSQPVCALVSDRQNTRLWGVVGVAVAAIGIGSLGWTNSARSLSVVYGLGMIGAGMFHPVAATTIGSLKEQNRNMAVSVFFVSGMLGHVVGAYCWPRVLTTESGFRMLPLVALPVFVLALALLRSFSQLAPQQDKKLLRYRPIMSGVPLGPWWDCCTFRPACVSV